jgi:hypothetical protein
VAPEPIVHHQEGHACDAREGLEGRDQLGPFDPVQHRVHEHELEAVIHEGAERVVQGGHGVNTVSP